MQNDSATQWDIHVEAEEHSNRQQSKQPGQGAAGVQPSRGHDSVIPERLTDCNVPAQRNRRGIYTKRYVVGFNLEVLLMKKKNLSLFKILYFLISLEKTTFSYNSTNKKKIKTEEEQTKRTQC